MPGKVKVKIFAGRNLPVMDRSSDTTDAYVEIKLGNTTYKTDVCRKSLNPQWNSEWYRFEVDDSELQDEPLQIRLMDHDTYSANDAIGKVYLNLNPLLIPSVALPGKYGWANDANSDQPSSSVMAGWIPVYDTMHGIRGEVNVTVKVELFSDFNKFRQSSCGVQFFCSPVIPHGSHAQVIHGFIEELVVNDDPEYQWIDKIRTPRASNEARQTLFFKLSGELQRKIGVKALDLGGNAVIGYNQCFDLEGESGIVARGIGTVVTLIKHHEAQQQVDIGIAEERIAESPVPEKEITIKERHGHQRTESTGGKMSQSPARLNAIPCIHRRSSDSDLSITPKGNSLTGSDRSGGAIPGYHHIRSTLLRPTVDNFDMMEYPFLTMAKYPPGFILHLGGAVSARSVKLLERITNIEEPETRDTWWSELRTEIRTHARALNCNAVLGYAESTSICDEVCVLSASGTAAVIALYSGELSDGVGGLPNLHKPHMPNKDLMTSSLDRTDFERDKNMKPCDTTSTNSKTAQLQESPEQEPPPIELSTASNAQQQPTSCRICHIPYSESNMSFRVNMLYCALCKMAKVPDILLATIEMPEGLPITGRGCFLQSYVCRPKRDLKGELNAKEISESLPFLEYELHRLLVNKMKVKAMNTIFGLKVRITIGERMLVGIATGTAVFLLPLPPPPLPKLIAGNAITEDKKLSEMQKLLVDTVKKNKEIYELKDQDYIQQPSKILSDAEESDEEKSGLDLAAGNKDSCVLEVDDSEDIEVINLLVEPRPPDGFHVVNTENVPGLEELEIVRNLQMFTQVWRAKIPPNQSASHFGKHFQKLLQSVYFKLRRMIPCALCDLQFKVDLPEPDEIQLTLLGMALGLGDPMKLTKYKRKNLCHLPSKEHIKKPDDELIFSLEEDQIPENSIPVISQSGLLNPQVPKHRQKSPQRFRISTKLRHTPIKERHGVDITPLSYVPGGKIERYLGYLNFFFIRETTSIREGGGLSGFVHSFITEVLAIVRAHVTAIGGNAMVAYFMTECVLYHNAHKNQGQCLINVGGDVVFVSYFTEDV